MSIVDHVPLWQSDYYFDRRKTCAGRTFEPHSTQKSKYITTSMQKSRCDAFTLKKKKLDFDGYINFKWRDHLTWALPLMSRRVRLHFFVVCLESQFLCFCSSFSCVRTSALITATKVRRDRRWTSTMENS